MSKDDQSINKPTDGIWNRFFLLIPLVFILLIACCLYIVPRAGSYAVWMGDYEEPASVTVDDIAIADESVVKADSIVQEEDGSHSVVFTAVGDGTTTATLEYGARQKTWTLRVWRGLLIEGGINFAGIEAIQVSVIVFLAALTVLFASVMIRLWRTSWYGYTMVAAGGGFLFCFAQMVYYSLIMIINPDPNLLSYLWDIEYVVDRFSVLSVYFMVPLGLLVSVSNISLIRHEGKRLVNLLGIALSLVWSVAYLGWLYCTISVSHNTELPFPLNYFGELFSLAITFGECLLISTMICAWLAAHHEPSYGFDYLAILGCGIRDDGTPCPLLAGRVDRAVGFDEKRQTAGDEPCMFVPSGGQGSDEPISEAQSMATYLEEKRGVAHERIVLEDRSTTTRENMAFTREVIEAHAGCDASELKIGFSTTNYHVFRGYVCAHQAGMSVEGLGSKTKYYFWPNAFLREFAGLLVTRWRAVLQTYLVIAGIYILAKVVLSLAV